MDILTLFIGYGKGGAYKRFELLISALKEKGYSLHIATIKPVDFMKRSGTKIITFQNLKKLPTILRLILLPIFVIKSVYRVHPKILFSWGYSNAFYMLPAKILFNIRLVIFIRTRMDESPYKRIPLLNHFMKLICFRFSNSIITVNRIIAEDLSKEYNVSNKINVLYNNIHEYYRLIERKDNFNNLTQIAYVGKLNKNKNIIFLIDSLKKISNEHFRLIILGEGDCMKSVKNYINKSNFNNKVHFYGWVENVREHLLSSDILILPSCVEGCPNSLLEALGCGCVCLGSNIPEIKEILFYDELLFELNSPLFLAQKIERIIANKEYRLWLKKMCTERKNQFCFNWEDIAINYLIKS
jgi:glycosyltransferase involved in cell wall biosynthesis